jgi:dipeptidyl aminopeptidase/acylaminoacyl peptidase|tara:strand:- start:1086 stop:3119 length:2034 start_codon:yes stop_codon:yes gene_type:complete
MKKSLQINGFILLCILLPLLAQAQDESQRVTIDDLMSLQSLSSPQISPDGEWVAYVVRSRDMEEDKSNTQVFMVATSGGEPIPMTDKETSASDPQWSPDGKFLSFTASKGEDAKTQIWTLNRLGGEAVQLTNVIPGVGDYAWSPDGSRLLLTLTDPKPADLTEDKDDDNKAVPYVIDRMQFKQDYSGYLDRRRTHVYVYTPNSDTTVQLTFGDYDDSNPVWSPDGKSIALVSDRSDNPDLNYGTDIFVVNVDDKDPVLTQITSNPGRDFSPAFSPDSKSIAYVTSTGPDVGGSALTPTKYLAVTEIGADQRSVLTANLDRSVSSPEYSSNGRDIYFRLEDSGMNHFARVRARGGDIVREVSNEVSVRDFARGGGRTVLAMTNAESPTELYSYADDALTRLTFLSDESLSSVVRAEVEKLRFNSADGTPVEAFLVKPVGYQVGTRYPTILWLHGGPASQFNFGYNDTAQLFAANGYAVIMPNPRGSTGYGSEFAHGTVAAWGENDFDDVMAAIDYGIKIGVVDSQRTGVGGWSYGGILTNYVITQTQRFKAAMSGASLGLVTSNYGHDQYQLMYELEFGLPWENPQLWAELSPFNKVQNITTPTLWMGGEVDWNVPINNSEQMYIAMKRLGQETQLVVYPDEHHGIRRPSFQKDRFERWISWFDRYLKPAPLVSELDN